MFTCELGVCSPNIVNISRDICTGLADATQHTWEICPPIWYCRWRPGGYSTVSKMTFYASVWPMKIARADQPPPPIRLGTYPLTVEVTGTTISHRENFMRWIPPLMTSSNTMKVIWVLLLFLLCCHRTLIYWVCKIFVVEPSNDNGEKVQTNWTIVVPGWTSAPSSWSQVLGLVCLFL